MAMNQTLETIFSRRTVRRYQTQQLKDQDIETILKAAIAAPSSNNMQGWHFTVVQNKELIEELEYATRKGIMMYGNEKSKERVADEGYRTFYGCPTLIMISSDKESPKLLDVSAAAENILLAAWSLGIASCYLASPQYGFMTDQGEDLSRKLKFPVGYQHIVTIGLGYMAGELPSMPTRKADVIHWIR